MDSESQKAFDLVNKIADMRTEDILLLLRQFKNSAYAKEWKDRDLEIIAITIDGVIGLIKETYKINHG